MSFLRTKAGFTSSRPRRIDKIEAKTGGLNPAMGFGSAAARAASGSTGTAAARVVSAPVADSGLASRTVAFGTVFLYNKLGRRTGEPYRGIAVM